MDLEVNHGVYHYLYGSDCTALVGQQTSQQLARVCEVVIVAYVGFKADYLLGIEDCLDVAPPTISPIDGRAYLLRR